jgi:uracil-DNA glycosylase
MENIHSQRHRCPKCAKLLIEPFGNPTAPYLLVGDFPGYHETMANVPFAFRRKPTETRSGDILRDELNRVGISIQEALLTNLWQHQKDDKECDLSLHLDQLTSLFKDRTHVLLMGSDVTQALLGVKVNVVSGLNVKVPGFAKVRFWVSPNPSLVMGQPIGELRLAFSRFAEDVKRKSKN